MKQFSEVFSNFMEHSNLTWTEAADRCGVDRTLLSRYAAGKKLPESSERVSAIAKGLGMSKEQKKELRAAYQCSKSGGYLYGILVLLQQIFGGKAVCPECQSDYGWVKEDWEPPEEGGTRYLHDKKDIGSAIRHLVRDASRLRIHMNDNDLLSGIRFRCKTEHIVELDSVAGRKKEVEEIERLLLLLNFGTDYRIYSHYRKLEKSRSLMARTAMLLSDKGIILFTEGKNRGVYTREAGCGAFYGAVFEENLNRCRLFGKNGFLSDEEMESRSVDGVVENPSAGVSFFYQKRPGERIWVRQNGGGRNGFCIEEPQLMRIFCEFIRTHQ